MKSFSELFSAFDYIDEYIYICDMNTYDLVYCNKKLQAALQEKYQAEQSGQKCYQCIHKLEHPCVFCNIDSLQKENRCIWSHINPMTERNYLLYDSVITINEKDYRMEIALDAAHLEEAVVHTSQKLNMETHLTDCVRYLVKSNDFSQAVSAVLQTVLTFFGGERAYIFEFNRENDTARNTFEICAPGVTAQIDDLQEIPLKLLQHWLDTFNKESVLVIKDLEDLKEKQNRQAEYHELKDKGIRSLIAVPIFADDKMVGCAGVDNPSLNISNSDFMVNLAYFLGVEIGKNHVIKELRNQNFRDPLTGVYNRKGFEQITQNISNSKLTFAFLMIDIDSFKMINDSYGHTVGDKILKDTAKFLSSAFQSEGMVIRLGGDEFAVLLNNCRPSAWETICSKIQWMHTSMTEIYKKKVVTLSVGICFASGRYNEEIYRIADEALYYTKKNGRAGCTMINKKTGERKYWKDNTLSVYSRFVLNVNSTGLCCIEYPLDGNKPPRMICSSEVREMFSFPLDADNETCYQLWLDGIDPAYFDVLSEARQQLLKNTQVECTYRWNHPKYGLILIRTNGIGEIEDGIQIMYGYHHLMNDTCIVEKKEESQQLLEAMSSIYFASYYINLDNNTFSTIKNLSNERNLQMEEADAQKYLQNFVAALTKKSDHSRMNRFVQLSNLPQRMKNETHLDCEYYAVEGKKWCRATFIPVKYHEDKTVSHVLFVVEPLDVVKAQEAEESAQHKKTIESLYNHVPGGLVMYEWDNKRLKTLYISRFYKELYGDTLISKSDGNKGGPDFKRVHPDDLAGFKKAIQTALTQTHSLEYVYRGWDNKRQDYGWIKVNAVSEVLEDGTSLVYAMYSDVTGQKEAELSLMKKHDSLAAALSAFNQLCYEYDPKTHREECLTEDHVFHFPRVIDNYPESMLPYVHPDDRKTFLDAIHFMEHGNQETGCNLRLLRNGEYVWYAYKFQALFDPGCKRPIVSISIMDNSEHMTTIQNYQARMNIMMGPLKDAVRFGSINLTRNTYSVILAAEDERVIAKRAKTLDELFQIMGSAVVGRKEQSQFQNLFTRANLTALMKQGQMHVQMDHMYRTSSQNVEWVRTFVDMLQNPSSGDIVGVCYSKSIQNEKISNILLEKTLQSDYLLAAIVEVKSGRYYLFDSKQKEYCRQKYNFWDNLENNLAHAIDDQSVFDLPEEFKKETVLKKLMEENRYSYSFNALVNSEKRRLEVKYHYIDESCELLLATLRDITDSVIMEQLQHDNDRDRLTDLYNRRKVFAECDKLLKQHPQDQFAMLHFDIRHFHLYNTFFGDAAGDKLLCYIADMLRKIDQDFDYRVYGRIEADVFCVFFPVNQRKYQEQLNDLLHGLQDYRPDFLIQPAIGIYMVADRSMSIESMFTRASIAAKTVRSGVTDAIIIYDDLMEQSLLDEQQVINDMQLAIEQKQFHVYLQPKYFLKTRKPIGAEALVRWVHPQKGIIGPDKFIPIFERNGFIANLDRYMWEHVCRLLREWKDAGLAILPVSVNVSRISMYSPTTVQFLKDLVAKYQLDPKYLELELTETAYMDEPLEMKKQLCELQKYGFRILMDDFGSGYSSLNTLRELPVNCLKLDKEFLSRSSGDERGRTVLSSVVYMSRMLNLQIIAEGVETAEQAEFLSSIGCEYVQGFLFSKPIPYEEYEKMLTHG